MSKINLLDEFDIRDILTVSKREVRRLVRNKLIPYVELPNGEVRFDERDITTWLETRKTKQND